MENHILVVVPKSMLSRKRLRLEISLGSGESGEDSQSEEEAGGLGSGRSGRGSGRGSGSPPQPEMIRNIAMPSPSPPAHASYFGSPAASYLSPALGPPPQAALAAPPETDQGKEKSFGFSVLEMEKLQLAIKQGKTHSQAHADFPEIGAAKFKSRFYRVKCDMRNRGII